MRKLIMRMSVSIDGFVSTLNNENDWVFKTGDEESREAVVTIIKSAGIHIMGRKTFQTMAAYWPTAPGPFAAPMNEIPKAVFSKKGFSEAERNDAVNPGQSPAAASWAEARIFNGDLAEEIQKLKAEPGQPIVAHGGAGFMQSLIASGLIDEYHLFIHPVALGSGLPIFTGLQMPHYFKLLDVKAFPGGVVAHVYGK